MMVALAAALDAAAPQTPEQNATGSLRVIVRDRTELPIGAARVHVTAGEVRLDATTTQNGIAELERVPVGRYDVRVEAPGFADGTATITVRRGNRATRELTLEIAAFVEQIDVSPPELDQRMAEAFATELSRSQIEALPEDPDELLAALIELAGGDAALRIDGFLDGTLPPGTRIESIRIRQDGSSAGATGSGTRIEIRTEPGGDRWRANASARLRDESLNGRNRFITQPPGGLTRVGSWSMTGPLVRHRTGLSFSVERAQSIEQLAINAAGLDGRLSALVRQPDDRLSVSARVDQSLSTRQTLRAEVRHSRQNALNQGLSEFDLPERAFTRRNDDGELRVGHNATVGSNNVHDARLQVRWRDNAAVPASLATAIRVPGAISSGGAQQQGGRRTREFEYEDEWMMPLGSKHQLTTGFNVTGGHYSGDEWRNAGGTFTFASLDDLAAGRPATFTQRLGNPSFSYALYRFGEFVQDDYRVRRNLSLNLGLRHEFQTHLNDRLRVAPRLGVRWTPSARLRTALSANYSVGLQPFLGSLYEQTLLVDGTRQREVVVSFPGYPDPFAAGSTAAGTAPGVIRTRDDLRMPSTRRIGVGLDQPFGRGTRLRLNYSRQYGRDLFRSVDANAPMDGVRPDPSFRNITRIQSTARSLNDSLQVTLSTGYQPRRLNANVSYTLGQAFNEMDGTLTLPPNSADLAQEWGPSRQDIRHRLNVSVNSDLWAGFRINSNVRAQSASPYTVTTGLDTNGDGVFTERPAGVGRNGARGVATKNVDMTITWGLNIGERPLPPTPPRRNQGPARPSPVVRVEMYAQGSNVFNFVNPQSFSGVQTSPFFGQATSAAASRRFTFGVRASY